MLTSVQEARDAAEKANQLKDEFLATLSHELRNPLNVILGHSELLLRMREIEQSPRLVQMGEALRRNAQSQSQLINDLLDLSRLQRGKISLNQRRFRSRRSSIMQLRLFVLTQRRKESRYG